MRKYPALILSLVMVLVAFAGCNARMSPGGKAGSDGAAAPDTSNFIGEEKAKEIALEQFGVSSDGIRFDRVELDRDDGVWHYEVEFRQGRTEYDADIKADDGKVISFETDYND